MASVKFGKVTEKEAEYVIQCNTRSSLMDALESTREVIRRTATMCGAEVELDIAYPGTGPLGVRSVPRASYWTRQVDTLRSSREGFSV